MKIILFDGVCNFCNTSVNFILKHDRDKLFHFAPMQGEKGREILMKYGKYNENPVSLVFIDENVLSEGVDAVTGISKYLKGYRFVYRILKIIPHPLSRAVYSFIAKNRYRWFGKRSECRVPSPEEKKRFL